MISKVHPLFPPIATGPTLCLDVRVDAGPKLSDSSTRPSSPPPRLVPLLVLPSGHTHLRGPLSPSSCRKQSDTLSPRSSNSDVCRNTSTSNSSRCISPSSFRPLHRKGLPAEASSLTSDRQKVPFNGNLFWTSGSEQLRLGILPLARLSNHLWCYLSPLQTALRSGLKVLWRVY